MKTNNTYRIQEIDFSGEQLRDIGLEMAISHAESNSKGWKNCTYELFKEFLREQREPFLMEEFRSFCAMKDDHVPPPSNRAYGHIAVRAAKEGLIKQIGTRKVSNPRAHCANSALWIKL